MDSGGNDAKMCNGNDSSSVGVSNGGADKAEEKEVETSSLLCSALKKGGMKGRRQRSRRKKVQWNDCNGNKLVEIMEFQPSDSSDSEDEYADPCIYIVQLTRYGVMLSPAACSSVAAFKRRDD
ncbi:uncharacterized protein LOC110019585 isoform X1 [Phalaenopsis equestris]|uniref:uncharacterized protein LOC110019585 isoform X1 n=1 Tax=Phalaenopsis equestris TaxID=78828 RepID=UPI0009E33752|nr:uncharacterized protein LOC110019585 isoform X1 [Phalaenopsis equestris]XP_020572975.1 uncharacterized protein LOC110019585 isoform X1 [Phalaenopsis equestris]